MGIDPKPGPPCKDGLGIVANSDGAFTRNDFLEDLHRLRLYTAGYVECGIMIAAPMCKLDQGVLYDALMELARCLRGGIAEF